MPPKQKRPPAAVKSPSAKKPVLGATAAVTEIEEDSDDYSDPEDDISPEEMESLEAEVSLLDFNSARDAGRERVAPRTRHQYDLFIGLMARFLKDDGEFAGLVISKSDSKYLSIQCPISLQAIKKYFDYVEEKQVPVRESDKESLLPSHQSTKHVGVAFFNTIVQSLCDLYKCEQVLMSNDTKLFIESRRSIYSRKIALLKANGLYPTPPSRFISDDGYVALCKTICIATPTEGCWADTLLASLWAYVVLLWNLMARCDRVAQLMWKNISWYKDCMTVFVAKSKSDQTGVRAFEKKLYCAKDPSVCPVLSCAVLFFTRTDYRSVFVFPRADTRRSGLRQLGHLIAARFSEANYALFGCNPLHIAWHHFKRGAFTFLGALTDGPSWVGCKLRADQTVSDSSKPYLYQGSGQDGLIGRLLALLPYGDPGFVEGPPALPADVVVPWDAIIPDWDGLPGHFKYSVVPRFFAVIAFHYDWLRENLHSRHPVFHCTLFTTHLELLLAAKRVVMREQLDMRHATGVPLSVRTAVHVQQLTQSQRLPQQTSPEQPAPAAAAHFPAEVRLLQPVRREANLGLRMIQVGESLPSTFRIPHYSCEAAWRAWWVVTDSLPMPLRFCAKKLPKGASHAAEATRFSRIKKVMSFIATTIPEREIIASPTLAFDIGWRNLACYMATLHVTIDAKDACSTVEEKVRRVADGIPKVSSLRPLPPLPHTALPLHEAAALALSVFDSPNLDVIAAYAGAASTAAQHRGTNPKWPAPEGQKFDGAVQCFQCPFLNCTSWQKNERGMTQHMDRQHGHQARAHFMHFYQNEWCFKVSRTCWCFPTGPNRTFEIATQETHDKHWIPQQSQTPQEAQTPAAPQSTTVTSSRRLLRPQIPPIAATPLTKDVEDQRARALAVYNAALLHQ